MKKLYLFLILIVLAFSASAQMKQRELDAIKNDTTLYYGLSKICESIEEATESAYNELYVNIAKNCNANAIYLADNGDSKKQLEVIIKTFIERIVEKSDEKTVLENDRTGEYQMIVCLPRADFREMCDDRVNDIQNKIRKGINMEKDACLEDALKSYYWALMLCYAHPQGKKLRFHGDVGSVNYEWLSDKISGNDGILRSFNFIVPKEGGVEDTKDGDRIIYVKVKTKGGDDVVNLRCEYHDGKKWMPNTVRDGKLIMQIRDNEMKEVKIKVNYDFKDDAKKMDASVSHAIENIKVQRYSNNLYTIDITKTEKVKEPDDVKGWDDIYKNRDVKKDVYLAKMKRIEEALRDHNISKARDCFSKEGYNMLDTLAHYGRMTVIGKPDYKFLRYHDEVLCRSILIQFDFRNTVGFSQEVVFRFDTINKVVTSLAFRLSDQSEADIISKTRWPEESRLVLVNFLEDYQTAYALKRHRYLESIYSDDALIIVGRVVQKTEIPDRMSLKLTDQEIELTKYDKNEYMNNLAAVFQNNEYIRLRFTETDFIKAPDKGDVYGVRVRQEYFSSRYGDVGYLFLLVDFRGKHSSAPLIHVRAWQPDKVNLDKLMNMSDVRFN